MLLFDRKGYDMAHLAPAFGTPLGLSHIPASHLLRWGTRQIIVCRDFRPRFYRVRPMIDCRPGVESGHLEILFFRKWLVVLSGVR